MQPIRLLKGFVTVGAWTMLSRVLGFVRDILIAATLGAGPVAEAFLVAFALPNMFRRFFAEGAFNMAFVPMFAKKLEGHEDAHDFARDAMAGMMVILAGFTVLGVVAMPLLVTAMAGGFVGDERFHLAVTFGRIAFPYILFISLAALVSGVLNATGRFLAAAAAPVLLNIVFIAVIAVGWFFEIPADEFLGLGIDRMLGLEVGSALALSVPLGGVVQLGLVWWAAARAGFHLVPRRPSLTPELKRLAVIAAPAALAGGVVQVNLLVGRQVASFFDGAIAWLNYADRLYQLPLGVVGIAIGVVLLPDLSRRLRAGDEAGGRHALSRAAEVSLALTVPAAVALVVIPLPLISVLFERGAFDAADSRATAAALAVYGLGLPAFVLQKVLQPLFYAREDTVRPFRYALVSLVVNAAAAVGLAFAIGYLGAAIGTTLAAWAMVVLLWRGSRDMGAAATLDERFVARLPRILAASAVMGACLLGAEALLAPALAEPLWRYAALAILVTAGLASYAAAGALFGAFSPRDFRLATSRSAAARR
ncbi:murein biosynthesis integral membrane protein MurJ [Roseitranquillus sediminis]|uniref:murein biosynthesis integral membrane protein MurJ n=1 Tax=Roseitranquillus sediminis TaxID=2809051 RepID=UPI001D0C2AAC|nr:murein biosynthesis integral membrane protein MurJ [Roseitranquillus sediminis]MBM9595269.1 murein biosynthesis integral membrane protein MurJ [Roseitranquillus sediminis]